MTKLSPATQAILDAIKRKWTANQDTLIRELSATAIRAAADNVVFSDGLGLTAYGSFSQLQSQLHQIASELDPTQ